MKVGKKLQGEGKDVYFSVSNHKDFSFELGEYGLNDVKGDKPVICARDDRDMKYIMSGDFRFVFFFYFSLISVSVAETLLIKKNPHIFYISGDNSKFSSKTFKGTTVPFEFKDFHFFHSTVMGHNHIFPHFI